MAPILELKNFHYYYGNIEAVKGIDIRVEPGEMVTLIGANGAGKTTTMQSISGLTPASGVRGEIWFDGKRIDKKKGKTQMAGTLSGGEQQMLAIGRAMMGKPKMILLDEPSLGLAPIVVHAIFEAIVEINRQGTTILFVEQNSKIALATAHRGYVMQTGKIVLADTCENLESNEEVKKAYLGMK